LFDLDGTLLPLDMDRFIEVYFQEMSKALHDIIEPKKLISSIWAGTDAMVKNIGSRTNEEVFIETCSRSALMTSTRKAF
jgi:phosphoglycolate phosphatase-like HAD superfamily hydrolase